MRFPWLQVDADFIGAHAGDLGAHLGISRREAMGLALDLWTWALARAGDAAPPDGLVTGTGPVPDRLLAGSVGWTGPAQEFSAALVAVGMAVRVVDGYRLTGFSRYKATWEKNRRRTVAKPERNRTGTGEEPARKTQTQTQKEQQQPSAAADAPTGGQAVLLDVLPQEASEPAPKPKPRKQADGEHHALWRALEAEYQRVMGHPYASGNGGADATAVKWLRETAKVPPEEAVRRWGNLLAWSKNSLNGFPTVTGFKSLQQHWIAPQVVGRGGGRLVDDVGRGMDAEGECSGCGAIGREATGYLAGYGEGTHLGARCGCALDWQASGVPYTEVAKWARERRAGSAI